MRIHFSKFTLNVIYSLRLFTLPQNIFNKVKQKAFEIYK